MPFKIIQTRERGKFILSVIPDKWEENGILHWPKRRVEDFLEQEASCPDDSWMTMRCQVKRTALISQRSADAELAHMLEESDTETEGQTAQTSAVKRQNVVQQLFDEIATQSASETDQTTEAPNEEEPSNVQVNNVIYKYNITENPQTSEQIATVNPEAISDILAITGALQQNQQFILDYLKTMEHKILRKLSYLSAQVDTIAERNVMAGQKAENVAFKIISNKEDLNNFEQQLENLKYRADMKNQLSCVCGKGKGRASSNAYSLADVMFTRHFMTQCSWGGGLKKDISKLCFKSYTKTVDLFCSVIHESDSNYTRIETEIFFKNIMRHSVSRNKQKIQRAASSRRRLQKQSKNPTSILASTAYNNGSPTNTANNIFASNQPSPTVDNAPTHTTAPSVDNNSFITKTKNTSSTVQPILSAVPAVAAAAIGD